MKTQRISELFSQLDADQVLLTDMNNVYYFSGELIYPGSRILPVILKRNGSAVFFLNWLYEAKFRGAEGMEVVRFSDTDDLPALLAHHLDSFACLAVDGKMASSHLLAIQALGAASGYIDASRAVSRVRGRKDAQEIALMKEASRINDLAMDRFKKLVKPGVSEKQVAEKIEGIYRELDRLNMPLDFGFNCRIVYKSVQHSEHSSKAAFIPRKLDTLCQVARGGKYGRKLFIINNPQECLDFGRQ